MESGQIKDKEQVEKASPDNLVKSKEPEVKAPEPAATLTEVCFFHDLQILTNFPSPTSSSPLPTRMTSCSCSSVVLGLLLPVSDLSLSKSY